MRNITLALAALAAIGIAAPITAPASAETVIIHKRHHFVPPPFRHHGDRTVIIRHHDED